jgi:DNA transposition AAA+ family ATPase
MIRIAPEALALKLQAVRNLEFLDVAEQLQTQPRLVEALWFLQAMSLKPGGLGSFAERLVAASEHRFEAVLTYNVFEERRQQTKAACIDVARRDLGRYLADLCIVKAKGFSAPWYFRALFEALYEAIDSHKRETLALIAETETTRQAFHWLEFSSQMGRPVPIIGASRFGKTTAVAAWCESRPGLARIVTVPQSNTERDLLLAIGDAFGLAYTHNTPTARIRDQVQLILHDSGLFIVFDEAHFLIPIAYSKNTPPRRLNWVRCQLIDKGVACAFFATPQSYKQTLDRYAKETGYALEQWLGRMAPAVKLPEDLEWDDLLAVAKLRFPGIATVQREKICAAAMASEGYLQNIELFAEYAQFLAGQRGAVRVAAEDVDAAIRHFIPAASPKPAARPVQPSRNRFAEQVHEDTGNNPRLNRSGLEAVAAGLAR